MKRIVLPKHWDLHSAAHHHATTALADAGHHGMSGTATTESGLHALHLPGAHLLLMLLFVVLEVFPITLLVPLEGFNQVQCLHLLSQDGQNRPVDLLSMLSDSFFEIVDRGTSAIQ